MTDIQLYRPQRLTDNPDGGGLATATPIVDGEANNLFDDISRIDRVNGELSLRKAFVLAPTEDTELYSDLHVVVKQPPLDPRVSAVLFKATAWDDVRDDAKNYVERYVDASVITRMIPYDRQLAGARAVIVYQRSELSLPEIGEVYALHDEDAGVLEYFCIQSMDHEVQIFTDERGDYEARVITLKITQPLSRDFLGSQPNRYFTPAVNGSLVRETITSDAARYKGTVALAQDADEGDLSIHVKSVFAQLVPAAKSEIPVTDAPPDGAQAFIPAAGADVVFVVATSNNVPQISTSTPILPGSVELLTFDFGGFRAVDKDGLILRDGTPIGTVNYAAGVMLAMPGQSLSNTNRVEVHYRPAVQVTNSGLSYAIPVLPNTRGYVYTATLRPLPAAGSVMLSFMAQGRRYTMRDDGSGALRGDVGVGSGVVNLLTGTLQATLGALPDIGSSVVISYGTIAEYQRLDEQTTLPVPYIEFDLEAGNCEPGSLTLTWLAGGSTRTAVADVAGVISGDATGRVLASQGRVTLQPNVLPDSNTVLSADYSAGAATNETFTPVKSGNAISLQLADMPRAGSLVVTYTSTATTDFSTFSRSRRLTDNGLGQLVDESGTLVAGSNVNYEDGLVFFNPDFHASAVQVVREDFANPLPSRVTTSLSGTYTPQPTQGVWVGGFTETTALVPFENGTPVTVTYKDAAVSDVPVLDETHPVPALRIDLTPLSTNVLVPGGVAFDLAGKTYADRGGVLYADINGVTGAGIASGSIDYASGVATLTRWAGGVAPTLAFSALLSQVAPLPLAVVHGMAPGRPLRPGTFYVQALRYRDGQVVSGLADATGNIDGDGVHGSVDADTGSFSVAFGAYVLDSSLSAEEKQEPWYKATNVDSAGYIWRPDEVIPGSVRYNCVIQTSLPLDPEIIKVNPVRLPLDGRVPVIRAGDTLVIHDTQVFTLPSGLAAGQQVTLPRNALAGIALYDANGLGIPGTLYTSDLASGAVEMASPLDLTGFAQPLVALHWVEDMALCLDAQITGEVTLSQPLSRGYSAANAQCSSALILGDAQASYGSLFVQATWLNHWLDEREGSAPASGANYNAATYPIEVLNRDAITQRWALIFTSATAFNIVGETLGVIGTGTTSTDVAPINPATGHPLFLVRKEGFGGGYSTGNVIRFNTRAAGAPIWIARTVLGGASTVNDDRIRLEARWDEDAA